MAPITQWFAWYPVYLLDTKKVVWMRNVWYVRVGWVYDEDYLYFNEDPKLTEREYRDYALLGTPKPRGAQE